ncbi:hypothetical protein V2J09_021405 [Rumex salicifolius]
MQPIIQTLTYDPTSKKFYTLENNILHYKGRLVVAPGSPSCQKLLAEYHAAPAASHSAQERMKQLAVSKRIERSFERLGSVAYNLQLPAHCKIPSSVPWVLAQDIIGLFSCGSTKHSS